MTTTKKAELLKKVAESCSVLTAGMSIEQKGKFMVESLGVQKFDDLKKTNEAFLTKLLQELSAEIEIANVSNSLKKQGAVTGVS